MIRTTISLLLFCAISLVAVRPASAVTIAWSAVGNAGNANDPATGSVYGAVDHNYNIGTYDVTNSQYVEFLNSNDPTGANTLGLYNSNMSSGLYNSNMNSTPFGGIINTGPSGSVYSVISGDGNHPVNYVTWYDAIRFANWLNNGQVAGSTETGAYTLLGSRPTPTNGSSITRNTGASVFLPSENEWYKAAFYDPRTTAQGGPPSDSHYWPYATTNSTVPTATGPTATPNSANYLGAANGLTDVGAYSGTTSPSGAFDMLGDVGQWDEALTFGLRGVRGSNFQTPIVAALSSAALQFGSPTIESYYVGFRVASIPEPSTGVLALVACGLMWVLRKRFR